MQRSVAYVALREMMATERRDSTGRSSKSTEERKRTFDRCNERLGQYYGEKREVMPLGLVPAIQR